MERKVSQVDWKKHLEIGKSHSGGIKSYCREQGIRNSTFHYWKNKLKVEARRKPVVSVFSAVEVISKSSNPIPVAKLPDAKWLADFLKEYAT